MSTRTQAFSLVITAVLALGASAGGASAHSWRCDSSLGAWGRAPGERGRVAYFTTDGGTAQPPDGRYRTAKVLRADLSPIA